MAVYLCAPVRLSNLTPDQGRPADQGGGGGVGDRGASCRCILLEGVGVSFDKHHTPPRHTGANVTLQELQGPVVRQWVSANSRSGLNFSPSVLFCSLLIKIDLGCHFGLTGNWVSLACTSVIF